jgi:hypothetical protein
MKGSGSKIGIALVWITLLLPSLIMLSPWEPGRVLHGQSGRTPFPDWKEWTWNNIRTFKVQARFERALGDNAGLRNVLVRTYNELDYRLFGSFNASGVIVGKDGEFLEVDYVDEVSGLNSIGEGLINRGVMRLASMRDSLADSYGIQLMVVLAPSKARSMPELLPVPPDFYAPGNYAMMLDALRSRAIDVLDLNPSFMAWDDTSAYPLFPRFGGHWSEYGAILAADTLLDWLAERTGLPAPVFNIEGMVSGVPSDVDYDLGTIMNLYSRLDGGIMAYPWYSVSYPASWDSQDWLIIGDSHFEQLLFKGILNGMKGGDPEFWMYNRIRVIDKQYPGDAGDRERAEKIPSVKYLVIFISERFYHTLFWGAPLSIARALSVEPLPSAEEVVIGDILNDAGWFGKLRDQAIREGLPIDTVLTREARRFLRGN